MNYEEALQEALTAVNAQAAQQQMAANIEAGNSTYGQMKDQAATNRSLERSRLAQRMQDLGLGAQQPLTVQNNYAMAGQRDLGDIGRANQQYTDTQNTMINQANANAGAQAAGITGQMNAAQSAADLEDRMNEFDRYYRMYMAKKITASQFRKKTGMDVRGWGRYGGLEDFNDELTGDTPPTSQPMAGSVKTAVSFSGNSHESCKRDFRPGWKLETWDSGSDGCAESSRIGCGDAGKDIR